MTETIGIVIDAFAMTILKHPGGVKFTLFKHFFCLVAEFPAEIPVNVMLRVDAYFKANDGQHDALHDTGEVMSNKLLCVVHKQSILIQILDIFTIWMTCL